jgi:hypothetical protein
MVYFKYVIFYCFNVLREPALREGEKYVYSFYMCILSPLECERRASDNKDITSDEQSPVRLAGVKTRPSMKPVNPL